MTVDAASPSVFDADLPTLTYELTDTPFQVCARLREAQQQSPVVMGPVGPEVLSYEFARGLLRDTRFVIPPGIHLTAQGVTSGPLWDKVVSSMMCKEGEEHHRLRGLVSRAFTPRATNRLHDQQPVRPGGRRRPMRHRRRHLAVLPNPHHLCIARCASGRLG
jgi:cytochrome P450